MRGCRPAKRHHCPQPAADLAWLFLGIVWGYSRSRPRRTGAGTPWRPRPSGASVVAARYNEGCAALVRDWSLVIDTCP